MIPANRYRDRPEAGHALARLVAKNFHRPDPLVLALPRGGVPVGRELARALGAPLDVFVVRKLGLPGSPETAMGAIATGGSRLLDDALIANAGLGAERLQEIIRHETLELERREILYRGRRATPKISGRHLVLVDDGVATGYTMRVAILALRGQHAASLTIAVPVGAPETCALLAAAVDEVFCPLQPSPFHAVGLWYDHFPPVTDADVHACLEV